MLVYQRVTKGIPEKVNGDLWRSAENDPKWPKMTQTDVVDLNHKLV